jgi:hypothetical protein
MASVIAWSSFLSGTPRKLAVSSSIAATIS